MEREIVLEHEIILECEIVLERKIVLKRDEVTWFFLIHEKKTFWQYKWNVVLLTLHLKKKAN